jgi:hypothetical protein
VDCQMGSQALQMHPHLTNATSGTCDNCLDHFVGMCVVVVCLLIERGSSEDCGVLGRAIEAPKSEVREIR